MEIMTLKALGFYVQIYHTINFHPGNLYHKEIDADIQPDPRARAFLQFINGESLVKTK
jgi:hypothetical protein